MISYYITLVIGTIFGYFLASLMMANKQKTFRGKIDKECHSFYAKK